MRYYSEIGAFAILTASLWRSWPLGCAPDSAPWQRFPHADPEVCCYTWRMLLSLRESPLGAREDKGFLRCATTAHIPVTINENNCKSTSKNEFALFLVVARNESGRLRKTENENGERTGIMKGFMLNKIWLFHISTQDSLCVQVTQLSSLCKFYDIL